MLPMRRAGSAPGAAIEGFLGWEDRKKGDFFSPLANPLPLFPVLPGNLGVLRRFPAPRKLHPLQIALGEQDHWRLPSSITHM